VPSLGPRAPKHLEVRMPRTRPSFAPDRPGAHRAGPPVRPLPPCARTYRGRRRTMTGISIVSYVTKHGEPPI
jgi:hypothetical protein